jgi:hypothetical protein
VTFSYSGNPGASDLDALRFLIGDTDSADAQLTDEELSYLLTQHDDSVRHAGLSACRRLIAKYSRCVDQRTGDIDVKYSQRVSQLRSLMVDIREGLVPSVYAGGISKADIEAVQDDDDRQGPMFALGMLDYPSDADTSSTGGTGGVV